MNYGTMYEVVKFNETALNDIKRAISSQELEWEEGLLEGDKKSQTRKSDIAWIKDQNLVNNCRTVFFDLFCIFNSNNNRGYVFLH